MAERKAVNKYYPPDWDPSKGSINKHVGQHPLRERARKLGQGILVIRFEMPYNIWCEGCNNHIGMGVRYNAEKSKTGNYYSTPIYKFRMKCHLCPNYIVIQTDPKNHDYVILEGARRKEQRWDPKENEQIVPEDKRTQKKLATDAMFKLEHRSDDTQRGRLGHMSLTQIEDGREAWKDDYVLNKILRGKFRDEKKAMKEAETKDKALLDKSSLDIKLLAEDEQDKKMAGLIKYSVIESYDEKQKQKRKAIEDRPLFESPHPKMTKVDSPLTKSRSAKITKQLGLSALSGKKNPFDTPSMVRTNSDKGLALGIRKKSVDKTEIYSPPKFQQSVISNCDSNDAPVDADVSSTIVKMSPQNPGHVNKECIHLTHELAQTGSVVPNGTADLDCSSSCVSTEGDTNCTIPANSETSQSALGTLMSNYSDSEEDT